MLESHTCSGDVTYHHVWSVTATADEWPHFGIWVINTDGSLTWQTLRTDPDGSVRSWCHKAGTGFSVSGFVLLQRP